MKLVLSFSNNNKDYRCSCFSNEKVALLEIINAISDSKNQLTGAFIIEDKKEVKTEVETTEDSPQLTF